jgi:hypothetical protein
MPASFDLPVVVSGQGLRIRVSENQLLSQVVHEALQKSGNVGQDPSDWELRLNGNLLSLTISVSQAGLSAQTTVFLSPKTGSGG